MISRKTPSEPLPPAPLRQLAAEPPQNRFTLIDCGAGFQPADFAREVQTGLTSCSKRLSCRFFYDQEGSALFEAICELPEYYLMRVEREILEKRAGEIAGLFPEKIARVELGSGSASKTRILIEEFLRRQPGNQTLRYVPVDISRTMLEESSLALLRDYPPLEIVALAGEYHDCFPRLGAEAAGAKLVLWLGSNVGNLDRQEAAAFLREVGQTMSRRDRLLVGIDLRKDSRMLQRAYDDSSGVTARFNRNLLARINRELGGHFDLQTFKHQAVYDEKIGRVEIYLVSARAQRVSIDRLHLEVPFAAGERVHTENSYKYSLAEIEDLAAASGLLLQRQWLDANHRFSVNLLAPIG